MVQINGIPLEMMRKNLILATRIQRGRRKENKERDRYKEVKKSSRKEKDTIHLNFNNF